MSKTLSRDILCGFFSLLVMTNCAINFYKRKMKALSLKSYFLFYFLKIIILLKMDDDKVNVIVCLCLKCSHNFTLFLKMMTQQTTSTKQKQNKSKKKHWCYWKELSCFLYFLNDFLVKVRKLSFLVVGKIKKEKKKEI